MADQAQEIRELKKKQSGSLCELKKDEAEKKQTIIAFTSGKGGVGKTNLVVNLGISLAKFGHRVLILDADLGLANVDLLMGLTPRYNLSHVISGKKNLEEIIITGPSGIRLIPCGSGGRRIKSVNTEKRKAIIAEIREKQRLGDTVLIDTGGGITDNIIDFLILADEVFLVTTPEPTSIMDSYGIIKNLAMEKERVKVRLIVNMAGDGADAEHVLSTMELITKQFFNVELDYLGFVSYDQTVLRAVRQQQPFVLLNPSCRAARDIDTIAMKIADYEVSFRAERGIKRWLRHVVSLFRS